MSKSTATVGLRLLPEIDAELRNYVRRRGDLARMIVATLEGVDLGAIPLIEIIFPDNGACETVCNIPSKLYTQVKAIASERGVSSNCLLNSAISAYTKKLAKKKS